MKFAGVHSVESREVAAAIAFGLVPGMSSGHKFGGNTVVGASFEAIWTVGGSYNFLSTADTIRVRAGGDAQDGVGGTGARTVVVQGLDATGADVETTLTTAGIAASASSSESFWRVNRAFIPPAVGAVGSNESNVAAIDIETTGGTLVAQIALGLPMGEGQSEQAIYTVPLGHEMVVVGADITTDGNAINVVLCQRQNANPDGGPYAVRLVNRWTGITESSRDYRTGLRFPALTDVFVEAQRASGSSANVQANFDYYLRSTT